MRIDKQATNLRLSAANNGVIVDCNSNEALTVGERYVFVSYVDLADFIEKHFSPNIKRADSPLSLNPSPKVYGGGS